MKLNPMIAHYEDMDVSPHGVYIHARVIYTNFSSEIEEHVINEPIIIPLTFDHLSLDQFRQLHQELTRLINQKVIE